MKKKHKIKTVENEVTGMLKKTISPVKGESFLDIKIRLNRDYPSKSDEEWCLICNEEVFLCNDIVICCVMSTCSSCSMDRATGLLKTEKYSYLRGTAKTIVHYSEFGDTWAEIK